MPPTRTFKAAVLAAALLLPAACGFRLAGTERSSAEPGSGRPVVLLLHGRGFHAQDTAALRREWLAALNLGLDFAGSRTFLGDDDLRLVWYADALDPRAASASASAAATACLGEGTGLAARGVERDVASVLAGAGALLAMAAEWVREPEGAALRALAGDLRYFGDDALRCAAEARLAEALDGARREGRPVVLVAHSYGSLVAYSHLVSRDAGTAPPVERYVTIGSLIGRPELRRLLVGPDGQGATLPEGVGSWVNVRDPRDPFSAPLLGLPREGGAREAILDVVTERPPWGDPHDARRYLADPVTARAILGTWCARGAAPGEPACEAAEAALARPPAAAGTGG